MEVGGGDSAHGKGVFLIREGSEPDGHAEEGAFLGVIESAEIVGIDIDVEEAVSAVQAEEFGTLVPGSAGRCGQGLRSPLVWCPGRRPRGSEFRSVEGSF